MSKVTSVGNCSVASIVLVFSSWRASEFLFRIISMLASGQRKSFLRHSQLSTVLGNKGDTVLAKSKPATNSNTVSHKSKTREWHRTINIDGAERSSIDHPVEASESSSLQKKATSSSFLKGIRDRSVGKSPSQSLSKDAKDQVAELKPDVTELDRESLTGYRGRQVSDILKELEVDLYHQDDKAHARNSQSREQKEQTQRSVLASTID